MRLDSTAKSQTCLSKLYLNYFNAYEGGIPPKFGSLTSLIHLNMANCGLCRPIPPKLGQLAHLDSFPCKWTIYLELFLLNWQISPTSSFLIYPTMNSLVRSLQDFLHHKTWHGIHGFLSCLWSFISCIVRSAFENSKGVFTCSSPSHVSCDVWICSCS